MLANMTQLHIPNVWREPESNNQFCIVDCNDGALAETFSLSHTPQQAIKVL